MKSKKTWGNGGISWEQSRVGGMKAQILQSLQRRHLRSPGYITWHTTAWGLTLHLLSL